MQDEALDLLAGFIKDILEPALVWKAGRNAESIRAMAIQALCSIECSCTSEAREIFPGLAKQFVALVEDELAVTRAYAIRCVLKSGPFSYEDYRQLTIGKAKREQVYIFAFNVVLFSFYLLSFAFSISDILSRLDDPCANVRCLAIECLPSLEIDRADELFSESSLSTLAEAVISRLLLYLDDPYIKIRPMLLGKLLTTFDVLLAF